jgi:hypothetical protein
MVPLIKKPSENSFGDVLENRVQVATKFRNDPQWPAEVAESSAFFVSSIRIFA